MLTKANLTGDSNAGMIGSLGLSDQNLVLWIPGLTPLSTAQILFLFTSSQANSEEIPTEM